MKTILSAALICLAASASAQSVQDCGPHAAAVNIAEPWQEHTRTYADGDVRVAVLDTVTPDTGSEYLLILSPPVNGQSGRKCWVIGAGPEQGFSMLRFDTLVERDYPDVGLRFQLLAEKYAADRDAFEEVTVTLAVNPATGVLLIDPE